MTSGALLISGISAAVAAIIAVWGVITQRIIARRRATMDMLFNIESDGDLLAARKLFRTLAKEQGGLAPYADAQQVGENPSEAILTVLNQYELAAIGIQRGILDFEIYKRWNKTSVIQAWDRAAPFVLNLRARVQNHNFYCEFEALAWRLSHRKRPRWNRWRGLFF